ncbi:hypothetical protein UJ11_003565 [Salmonella enterica subsp. enterica]|nr:hypothetical protein [Salmonella enterica subsp. enterica serovar Baguida]
MPIENATYISDLNPDWPVGSSDFISQGDDQMRMQKKVLQNTFPNASAQITGTPSQLNNVTNGMEWRDDGTDPYWVVKNPETVGSGNEQAGLVAVGSPAISQLNSNPALTVSWSTIRDIFWPVGAQYVSYTDSRNPSDILLFGTWEPVVGMIAGVGVATDINGYAQTLSPGYQPGWWRVNNSQIVGQQLNVQLTMNAVPPHTHGEGTMNSYWGDSNHKSVTPGDGDGQTGSAGGHTPTGTGLVTIGSGSTTDGTQFYNSYYGVYIWRRTA